MKREALQALVAASFGSVLLVIIVRLSRRGLLSFRYTAGWIGVCCIGIFSALFVPIIEPISKLLGLSPSALLALAALTLLLVITVQLSISISGAQKHLQNLTEELARIRHISRTSNSETS